MPFSVGTNWDDDLIARLHHLEQVRDYYASLPTAVIGHGRPVRSVPEVTRQQAEEHIEAIHKSGRTFTFLLNAPSLGGRQFQPDLVRRIRHLLDWLSDIGVDAVTVSLPQLLETVKKHYPQLAVKISHNSTVLTVSQAAMFQDLGADQICLMRSTHRNKSLLRQLVARLSIPLQLICTSGCVHGCVNMVSLYHMSQTASLTREHGAVSNHGHHGQGYCFSWCHTKKLEYPEEILKAASIRPEDLHLYEAMGINQFKLDTRVMSTPAIVSRVEAYHARSFAGDLQQLISVFQLAYDTRVGTQMGTGDARGGDSEAFARFFSLAAHVDFAALLKLDNPDLAGFVETLLKKGCPASCSNCDLCARLGAKVQRFDAGQRDKMLTILRNYRTSLINSTQQGS